LRQDIIHEATSTGSEPVDALARCFQGKTNLAKAKNKFSIKRTQEALQKRGGFHHIGINQCGFIAK